MNVGKGSQFKGKSLADVEVTEDVLECDDEEEEEMIDNELNRNELQQNKTEIAQSSSSQEQKLSSSSVHCSNTRVNNRKHWANKEKQLVLKHFKKHIETKAAPRKHECLNFIKKNSDLFSESDWLKIKTLVFNTYRNK